MKPRTWIDLADGLLEAESQTGILIHSNQDSQYTSRERRDFQKNHSLTSSMSPRGNCRDNAGCWHGNNGGLSHFDFKNSILSTYQATRVSGACQSSAPSTLGRIMSFDQLPAIPSLPPRYSSQPDTFNPMNKIK
jgi:transposase InsO family protein